MWRYNIVAAKPVTDRDNGQQRSAGRGASGGAGAAPGAQDESGEVDVETWDTIRSRRNVRSYNERAIAPEDLDRILEAARRAPSAGNQQAWDFVVCTNREQLVQLARVWRAARHVAGSAATIALVAPRSDDAQMRDLVQFDLGQATMSAMLAAADLGIGSAHAGVHDQELARRLLGFPEGPVLSFADHVGRPRRPSARADRAARPTPVQRRRAPRPLVAAALWWSVL